MICKGRLSYETHKKLSSKQLHDVVPCVFGGRGPFKSLAPFTD